MQKQQMDWGAAERGGGTQPLFSLLSFCLCFCCLSACLPTFLSACLSVCLENVLKLTNTLLFSSCLLFSPLLKLNSPIFSLPLSLHHFSFDSHLLFCAFSWFTSLFLSDALQPLSYFDLQTTFCIFAFVLFLRFCSSFLRQQSHYHLSSYLQSRYGPWRPCKPSTSSYLSPSFCLL